MGESTRISISVTKVHAQVQKFNGVHGKAVTQCDASEKGLDATPS